MDDSTATDVEGGSRLDYTIDRLKPPAFDFGFTVNNQNVTVSKLGNGITNNPRQLEDYLDAVNTLEDLTFGLWKNNIHYKTQIQKLRGYSIKTPGDRIKLGRVKFRLLMEIQRKAGMQGEKYKIGAASKSTYKRIVEKFEAEDESGDQPRY
jgi:hypothetical protein